MEGPLGVAYLPGAAVRFPGAKSCRNRRFDAYGSSQDGHRIVVFKIQVSWRRNRYSPIVFKSSSNEGTQTGSALSPREAENDPSQAKDW